MLLVKTRLAPSTIHGIGLFADEFIPKGTEVWKFVPGFDLALSVDEVESLPEMAKAWIEQYGYLDLNLRRWIVCIDDARFFNHSQDPNTEEGAPDDPFGVDVASRDIKAGEEITCDYRLFDWEPR